MMIDQPETVTELRYPLKSRMKRKLHATSLID